MLFDGAVVDDNARVVNAVIGAGARVEERAVVYDTVVGDRAVIGAHCELRNGLRIWPDVVLPPHGVRFSADV
jgi:mannose-1-phosphate guanylyltransferase